MQAQSKAGRLTELVLRLVDTVRGVWPGYGHDRLTSDARHAVMEAFGVTAKADSGLVGPRVAVLVPRPGTTHTLLRVRPGLSVHSLRLVSMQAVAEVALEGEGATLPPGVFKAACHVFALVGVFNRADWQDGGERWVWNVAEVLEEVDAEWAYSWLPELLREVNAVLLRLPVGDGDTLGPNEVPALPYSGSSLALEVARSSWEDGKYGRAAAWYLRAERLARTSGEIDHLVRAKLGAGWVHIQQGEYARAWDCLRAGEDLARNHKLHTLEGVACNDLCALAILQNRATDVREYTRRARAAFGNGNRRLVRLCHNTAYFWMEAGRYSSALPVFAALARLCAVHVDAELWPLVQGALGRAAAGVGNREWFLRVWVESLAELSHDGAGGRAPDALLDLADGALMLGEVSLARGAACVALRLAELRDQPHLVVAAHAALERAEAPGGTATQALKSSSEDEDLSAELVEALGTLDGRAGRLPLLAS